MRGETALELAVGLLQLPSRARALRDATLPPDVEALLNIVAGDRHALAEAVRISGLPERSVNDAAGFYVEQILLHPGADSYRALGARPDATTDQLRRNMALLLRWLHPDHEANSGRAIYASRVTEAWNSIKTAERRTAYDAVRIGAVDSTVGRRRPGATAGAAAGVRDGSTRPRSARPPAARAVADGGRGDGGRSPRGRIWRMLGRLLGQ